MQSTFCIVGHLVSQLLDVAIFVVLLLNSIQAHVLSLVLLLISNLTNELHLHQFLVSKTTWANKSLKSDANGAY